MVVATQVIGGAKERTCPAQAHAHGIRGRAPLMLGLATLGFALNFWAWALLSPLAVSFTAALDADLLPAVVAGRGPRGGRLLGPHPGRCTHRPLRRQGDVPDRLPRHRRPGAVPGASRTLQPRSAPGRRVLPRHRRHGVRGRGAVRQRVVPPGASRLRGRRLRRRYGRHRHQRPDHRQAGQRALHQHPVRHHGGRPHGVRRPGGVGPARLPGAGGPDRVARSTPARRRWPPDHVAGRCALRDRLRRLRRLQRLPADLPEERLPADPGRCVEPDGGLRAGRGGDASGGGLALGPGAAGFGAQRRLRGGRRRRRHPVVDPVAGSTRHDRVPVDGGSSRRSLRSDLRPRRAARSGEPGRLGDRASWARPEGSAASSRPS